MSIKNGISKVILMMIVLIATSISTISNATVESNQYKIDRKGEINYILGIYQGTRVDNFIKNIDTTEKINIYNKQNKLMGETEIIKTGNKVKIGKEEYIAIVCGDTNQDGKVGVTDLVNIKQYLIGKEKLENEREVAADIDLSQKITSTDILNLKRLIVRIIEERQIYESEYTNEEYKYKINKLTDKISIIELANNKKSGTLQIPNKIDGAEVTQIQSALGENNRITNVIIPTNIEKISSVAFSGMRDLAKIEVSKLNKNYSSKEGVLYSKDETQLLAYPRGKKEEECYIAETVNKIGEYAFYKNNKLKSVYIPESIKEIGKTAFEEMEGTVYIKENSKVKSILNEANIIYKIDTAPKVNKLIPSIGTNQVVTLTIEANDAEGIVAWSIGEKEATTDKWNEISSTKELKTTYTQIVENGTYVLKVKDKAGNTGTKEVTITELDKTKPKVTAMKITSPASGEYKPGQKVIIRVEFNEKVKGTAPNLKLRIGDAIGTGEMTSSNVTGNTNYIDYTYTSNDEQYGKVEIYSYSGGELTDIAGNRVNIIKIANSGNSISSISPEENIGGVFPNKVFVSNNGVRIKYWLYIPDLNLVKTYKNIPVVVTLAMSGAGSNEKYHLGGYQYSLPDLIVNHKLDAPAIVIAPQEINEHDRYTIIELIESIPKEYNISINRNKISIAGHSRGARHALRVAKSNPNYFSACVLFSWVENGRDRHDMQEKPMPTCKTKFVFEDKNMANFNRSIATELSYKYNNISVETVSNTEHATVVLGFKTNKILKWMIEQTK